MISIKRESPRSDDLELLDILLYISEPLLNLTNSVLIVILIASTIYKLIIYTKIDDVILVIGVPKTQGYGNTGDQIQPHFCTSIS